jgi:hypothetical protein
MIARIAKNNKKKNKFKFKELTEYKVGIQSWNTKLEYKVNKVNKAAKYGVFKTEVFKNRSVQSVKLQSTKYKVQSCSFV